MFIAMNEFKKLIKAAYNNGRLVMGATEEEFFLEGGSWILRVLKDELPNKEKSAIIELTGEFPAAGMVFKASKGENNQYLIPENNVWNIREAFENCREEMKVTRSLYQKDGETYRIIQHPQTQTCIPFNEKFIKLLDKKSLRCEESSPEGPKAANKNGNMLYWGNETMTLAILPIFVDRDENKELGEYLQLLENIELPEMTLF